MLEVPASPKLYTTIYDNFKGVDLTNDASNIWKYRMAEGLNMAPDEAGQPWKRTGWEVAITKSQLMTAFQTATGQTATDISPQRVYYFELHSQDHMAYIANVRYGTQTPTDIFGVVFIIRQNDGVNEIELIKTSSTVSADSILKVDANRCFFFEGNGTAGFYMFKTAVYDAQTPSNSQINKMYIYTYEQYTVGSQDVEGFRTREVEPYVPTIIIARSPGGGDGTLLEGANMLTNYRKVRFYGDGVATDYILPTSAASANSLGVRIMNGEGVWEDMATGWTAKTVGQEIVGITFTTAPSESPITGEDNVEITYESTGATIDADTRADTIVCTTSPQTSAVKQRSRTNNKTYTYSGSPTYAVTSRTNSWYSDSGGAKRPMVMFTVSATAPSVSGGVTQSGSWSAWETTEYDPEGTATGSKVIDPSAELTFQKQSGASWVEMETSEYSSTFDSYSNTLNVTLNDISDWTPSSTSSTSTSTTMIGSPEITSDTTRTETYYKTIKIYLYELDGEGAEDPIEHSMYLASLFTFSNSEIIAYARDVGGVPTASSQYVSSATLGSRTSSASIISGGSYVYSFGEAETQTVRSTYSYNIKLSSTTVEIDTDVPEIGAGIKAFMLCKRATLFGSGLLNAVFMTGSTSPAYTSRVWYSGVGDPTYFPDTNYIEAGSNDTNIMGMIRVGEYLGIIKQGANIDATIYLAYPTSYDDNTTYAIKQSITGVGAVSNGAFNIISDDSLFLSEEGIMAVSPDDTERQVKNRSYFINKPLTEEENLSSAVSFVYDGMYLLCVPRNINGVKTGVCYVLDGSQKTSWANEKTNLQFEAYVWDNIPAQCFARYDGKLWFADFRGNLCRFKEVDHSASYHDDYSATNTKCVSWTGTTYGVEFNQSTYDALVNPPTAFRYNGGWKVYSASVTGGTVDLDTFLPMVDTTVATHTFTNSTGWLYNGIAVDLNDYGITPTGTPNSITVTLSSSDATMSTYGMTITDGIPEMWNKIEVKNGVPIKARFATISDNDGATQYFKNMQKKGVVVSLLPKKETGATIYVKADEKDEIKTTIVKGQESELPSDVFIKKKIKKYKRLQFVVENNNYDETFGVDSITKTYTLGNFSKNRRAK